MTPPGAGPTNCPRGQAEPGGTVCYGALGIACSVLANVEKPRGPCSAVFFKALPPARALNGERDDPFKKNGVIPISSVLRFAQCHDGLLMVLHGILGNTESKTPI